jgi:hypothetical protein
MPKNLLSEALNAVEEGNYVITNVRGYNLSAAEYAAKNSRDILKKYGRKKYIAISGRKETVIASGDSLEQVLDAVGGEKEVKFPNKHKIMAGMVRNVVSAYKKFNEHVQWLSQLDEAGLRRLGLHVYH